jgi:hypothetical protein
MRAILVVTLILLIPLGAAVYTSLPAVDSLVSWMWGW